LIEFHFDLLPAYLNRRIPKISADRCGSKPEVVVSLRRVPFPQNQTWRRSLKWSASGRRWLDEIIAGSITDAEQLAKREHCTMRQINLTLSLAFLAPQLVKAAVEGRLPRGINIERLRDPDAEWSKQFQDLGLNPN
jgi:hypothetical protein